MAKSQSVILGKKSIRGEALVLNRARLAELVVLCSLLALGLGLRLLQLTNPPLDFHPTRQLRSAIIARGMYYAADPTADPQLRQTASSIASTMERYEPPILEHLVAWTYQLLGGENLWMARVYSSLFWVIGGLALYGFVRRALSPGASLFSLAFYLILPWGVVASRTFQPDPWMVMWILVSAYLLYRWSESGLNSWVWGILSGLSSGLAVLIKVNAAYPVAGMAFFLLLTFVFTDRRVGKNLLALFGKPQLWVFAVLFVLIPGVYYIGLGNRSSEFASFWIFSFIGMLADRKFYIHWLGLIRGIMDVMLFFVALLSAFLFRSRMRAMVLGLWLGYFLIGATFPYQIYTHDYYSLPLVPIVAISLGALADLLVTRLRTEPLVWKALFTLALVGIGGYYTWVARSQLYGMDYRKEPIPWQIMGETLPKDKSIIALTHDYGNRLKYFGWRTVNRLWPSQGDLDLSVAAGGTGYGDFAPYFQSQTHGMDFFLVTLFGDLDAQPALKAMLYDHYPIYQQGDGYVLFDLKHPKP